MNRTTKLQGLKNGKLKTVWLRGYWNLLSLLKFAERMKLTDAKVGYYYFDKNINLTRDRSVY